MPPTTIPSPLSHPPVPCHPRPPPIQSLPLLPPCCYRTHHSPFPPISPLPTLFASPLDRLTHVSPGPWTRSQAAGTTKEPVVVPLFVWVKLKWDPRSPKSPGNRARALPTHDYLRVHSSRSATIPLEVLFHQHLVGPRHGGEKGGNPWGFGGAAVPFQTPKQSSSSLPQAAGAGQGARLESW